MKTKKSQTRARIEKREVVASFTYFDSSDLMGGDEPFMLALDTALARLEAACRCRTWGAYARLLGYKWKDFVSEWLPDEDRLLAREPLAFGEVWGTGEAADLIDDPRQRACDFLREHVPHEILHDSRLEDLLHWDLSSPGGGIDVLGCEDPRAFVIFEAVLHAAGFTGLTFKRAERPLNFLREAG